MAAFHMLFSIQLPDTLKCISPRYPVIGSKIDANDMQSIKLWEISIYEPNIIDSCCTTVDVVLLTIQMNQFNWIYKLHQFLSL